MSSAEPSDVTGHGPSDVRPRFSRETDDDVVHRISRPGYLHPRPSSQRILRTRRRQVTSPVLALHHRRLHRCRHNHRYHRHHHHHHHHHYHHHHHHHLHRHRRRRHRHRHHRRRLWGAARARAPQ